MSDTGDYISREATCLTDFEIAMCNGDYKELCKMILDKIANAPAADVRPEVRGKWEDVEVTYVADKTTLPFERISSMRCNQCNRYHTEIYYYGNPTEMAHFCPNCGAKMEG